MNGLIILCRGSPPMKYYFANTSVVGHPPQKDEILGGTNGVTAEGLWNMWTTIRHVLWQEGKWKDAEELDVKVMEARSRVLGEEHPDTLSAMANLARTKKDLGQIRVAIELTKRPATASSKILGYGHPDYKSRCEHAAFWSSLTTKYDGDGDRDTDEPGHSDDDGHVAV
jgi:hypothetical protein